MPGLTTDGARARLGERQRAVLLDLSAGRTPERFDPVGTRMTTRVLAGKRADGIEHLAPELAELPGWRDLFRTWAVDHPKDGCAHDDLRGFVASLGGHPWVGLHAVHDGTRRLAWTRLGRRRALVIGLGHRVWVLRRRTWRRREKWRPSSSSGSSSSA